MAVSKNKATEAADVVLFFCQLGKSKKPKGMGVRDKARSSKSSFIYVIHLINQNKSNGETYLYINFVRIYIIEVSRNRATWKGPHEDHEEK